MGFLCDLGSECTFFEVFAIKFVFLESSLNAKPSPCYNAGSVELVLEEHK